MSRNLRHLPHLLDTARAYQATYAGQPPHPDLYVRELRDRNDTETARLEHQLREGRS